jgi:hypothetical protein
MCKLKNKEYATPGVQHKALGNRRQREESHETRTRLCPKVCLCFDCTKQVGDVQLLVIEDSRVMLLPDPPRRKNEDERGPFRAAVGA